MKQLSNNNLIEVYERAKKYNLDNDFIELLLSEIKSRGIKLLDDKDIM